MLALLLEVLTFMSILFTPSMPTMRMDLSLVRPVFLSFMRPRAGVLYVAPGRRPFARGQVYEFDDRLRPCRITLSD